MSVPKSFDERQNYYAEKWKKLPVFQYSWQKSYDFIISALRLLRFSDCKTVVELGCNDGALAVNCLRDLSMEYQWTGYDFLPTFIKNSRWHPRYRPVLLDKYLWEMTDHEPFDIFVTSHTIEHLYPDEIQSLAQWLSTRAKFLIIVAPLGYNASTVRPQSDHILEKGSRWLSDVLQSVGFKPIWEADRYHGWFQR